jgi:hypothetical protein
MPSEWYFLYLLELMCACQLHDSACSLQIVNMIPIMGPVLAPWLGFGCVLHSELRTAIRARYGLPVTRKLAPPRIARQHPFNSPHRDCPCLVTLASGQVESLPPLHRRLLRHSSQVDLNE